MFKIYNQLRSVFAVNKIFVWQPATSSLMRSSLLKCPLDVATNLFLLALPRNYQPTSHESGEKVVYCCYVTLWPVLLATPILILTALICLKIGPIPASFCLFSSFPITISIIQVDKCADGVLGIRTRGRRMAGTDETTELWQPPKQHWYVCLVLAIKLW